MMYILITAGDYSLHVPLSGSPRATPPVLGLGPSLCSNAPGLGCWFASPSRELDFLLFPESWLFNK